MKRTIIVKIFYQTLVGFALSVLYMLIRPYESYTLAWPTAALGGWFLLMGWLSYLRYDRLSITKFADEMKKDKEKKMLHTKHKTKSFIDYVNAPIYGDMTYTDKEKLIIKMTSNFITAAIFFIATCLL